MIVDLLRHGTTGRSGCLDGRTDFPVDADGWTQFRSQTAGRTWPLVVTSPLRRARECAETLVEQTGMLLRIDPDWAEIDFGAMDGLRHEQIAQVYELQAARTAFLTDPSASSLPGGEPWAAFELRISRALWRLMNEVDAQPVLVISHAGAMRAAISVACGIAFGSLWAVRISHGTRVRLKLGSEAGGRIWGEIVEIAQP